MMRPALTAGLMILALAAPAAADGDPDFGRPAPAGYGRAAAGYERAPAGYGSAPAGYGRAPRRAVAPVPRHRAYAGPRRGGAVQPVSYGEPEGPAFHAWLPRNTNLPIYNIPPSFFPEP
ncbi:hypothetical protein DK419_04055 [Methylobacterium terrae]|uniref:Uncharacterized protein n=1 Tax=Methylobacterium terrae TaxID=2202827 RepID=A0A2U8WHG1_9HYPH|nr:hypothetical protein [Methylobacterium terrae]AWN45597.1 hypothetical protein DK419_04055 [Methylobacterium terrae]